MLLLLWVATTSARSSTYLAGPNPPLTTRTSTTGIVSTHPRRERVLTRGWEYLIRPRQHFLIHDTTVPALMHHVLEKRNVSFYTLIAASTQYSGQGPLYRFIYVTERGLLRYEVRFIPWFKKGIVVLRREENLDRPLTLNRNVVSFYE